MLASTFNPKTKLAKALWTSEYTSCERWAKYAKQEYKLLECFSKEATQAPSEAFKEEKSKRNKNANSPPREQARLRKKLTSLLNGLVRELNVYN